MPYSLNGKVVLVTGGASGIGAAVVKKLLVEDVKHIVILDVNEQAGNALKDELNTKYNKNKVTFIKCDVSIQERLIEALQRVRDEQGYIDVVINSAAVANETLESFAMEININFTAVVASSLNAWNIMHKGKSGSGGTIINFNSIAVMCDALFVPVYSATKSAVLKFSTMLGNDAYYTKSGVRVLTICFGVTNTPLIENLNELFDERAKELVDVLILKSQSPESAASAVMEAYKQGASGSVWLSTSGKPAIDVTETYKKSIELFSDYVFQ